MMTPPGSSRDRVHVDFLNDSVVPAAQDAVEARLRRKGSNLVAFPGRPQDEEAVSSATTRWSQRLAQCFRQLCCRSLPPRTDRSSSHNNVAGDIESQAKRYNLRAIRRMEITSIFFRHLCCCGKKATTTLTRLVSGIFHNYSISMYLHWIFKMNFPVLFILSCLVYFGLIVLFTGFIVLAGTVDPTCVNIGGSSFQSAGGNPFTNAFSLSWTTFSTVGYGSASPATTKMSPNRNDCAFTTILCSFESFIGVLYSGFCGAILFGKVLRILSHAQVMFSEPLVVRYGVEGVGQVRRSQTFNHTQSTQIPCPVLEFRVANLLFNEVGGEILDATLNVVANVDATNDGGNPLTMQGLARTFSTPRMDSVLNMISSRPGRSRQLSNFSQLSIDQSRRSMETRKPNKIVPKRAFSKMRIESPEHPFFKRVWVAQHILNEFSPIVTPRTRKAIRNNGGFWPEYLNNYKGVRQSLKFNQILVSLHGVSNVSATDVYAQHIYDFVDLNVGYQFVNLLYQGKDRIHVDTTLMNDVMEQAGGDGEPLIDVNSTLGKNRKFMYYTA